MSANTRADAFGLYDVNFSAAGRPILTDVTLPIRSGEIHALAGSKNSGKSAICAVITGAFQPDSGRVRLRGRDYAGVTSRQARAAGVSIVSSIPKVFPQLTVGENLLSGETLWRRAFRPWGSFLRDIGAWLEEAGISLPLGDRLDTLPYSDWLFIEMLGRLHRSPGLIIMDETLEAIPPGRRRLLMPILKREMAKGMAALWVTHKVEDALLIVDRLSVIRNGKLLLTAPPGGLDTLNLIQLCYAQLEELSDADATMHQFHQLMRFTGALVRDLPQAVAILDMDRKTGFINREAERLFAVSGGEWLHLSLGDLLGESNRDLAEVVHNAMDAAGDAEWHNRIVRHAGGETLSDVTLRRIMENAVCVGYMLQIDDVSAREELRRRIVLSSNLASVGLLAAGVAHEVNNPLEIIGNYLTYLKRRASDPEAARILLKVEEENARIQQIVNNLIVYSGASQEVSVSVDLPALCLELAELLRFHHRDRRIAFAIEKGGEPIFVRADPNELRQVFLNLFRNSLAAIPDGGKITASFAREDSPAGPVAVMCFSDNGPGIALKNPDDIFLPFVTTRQVGGKNQGLGLFIVYGIIEKYGGTITVLNLPEGGCRFTIVLPLAPTERPAPGA